MITMTERFQLPHLTGESGFPGWDFWGLGVRDGWGRLEGSEQGTVSRGTRTCLGGMGRPLLGPLEMWKFLLDTLPSNPSGLCHKKQSLRVEFGGTGVLPPVHSEGSAWGGDRWPV